MAIWVAITLAEEAVASLEIIITTKTKTLEAEVSLETTTTEAVVFLEQIEIHTAIITIITQNIGTKARSN